MQEFIYYSQENLDFPLNESIYVTNTLTNNPNYDFIVSNSKSVRAEIVGYLHETKNITKFAVFYQNDNYGEEGYISLIEALRKRNLKIHGEGMYKRNTLSIKHAFSEIKNVQPEAILMVGAYKANTLFIKKAREDERFKDVIFCNISFAEANQMIKELDYKTENLLFSQVVPSYNDYSVEIINEYKYLMHRYFPNEPLGFISLESFLAAKTVVLAIKSVEGTLTRKKFLEEIKKVSLQTLKGIELRYENTQLLNKVYLFKYIDSKFEEIKYDKN